MPCQHTACKVGWEERKSQEQDQLTLTSISHECSSKHSMCVVLGWPVNMSEQIFAGRLRLTCLPADQHDTHAVVA